jgi:CheY-like chemotaxis protein
MVALILALLEKQDNSRQVKTCLEECGHQVLVVNTFAKALALLRTQKIDLIISDVHLENGGSVFDFLRVVKKDQWTCEIPFVLFSLQPTPMAKYLADGVRTTARHLGAIEYIEMETFDAARFQNRINSLLPPEKQTDNTDKDSEIAEKVGG